MSTISRERAELKSFITGFLTDPMHDDQSASSMTAEVFRIALASLEAEAVCVIDQSNLDYLKSGSDADVWPASRAEMGDVLLYRSATPAPVSVPDEVNVLLNHLEDVLPDDAFNLIDVKTWNNVSMLSRPDVYRAAMLQEVK